MAKVVKHRQVVRVLLVHGDAVFCRILGKWLSAQRGLELAATATHGREAVAKAQSLVPDLVLMEVSLAKPEGLKATRAIRRALGGQPCILIFGRGNHIPSIKTIREAGATAYIPGTSDLDQLCQAISIVMNSDGARPDLVLCASRRKTVMARTRRAVGRSATQN